MSDTPSVADKFRAKHGNGTGWIPANDHQPVSNVIALVLDSPPPEKTLVETAAVHILLDLVEHLIEDKTDEEIDAIDSLTTATSWKADK